MADKSIDINTPVLYAAANSEAIAEVNKIRSSLTPFKVIDDLETEIRELYSVRHPQEKSDDITPATIDKFRQSLVGSTGLHGFGNYVYFPWNGYLVHFLPEDLHTELRTARNRNLITEKEQANYYNSSIGIAGLSIGNSIVGAILHTGGAKFMRLADLDTLSASNTNRIRVGFTSLGLKKTIIAAREVYETNPYAKLDLFSDGLTEDLIPAFLLKPDRLDLLIEETDSIYLKIRVRLLARKYRIPVMMATDNGDNILLDIERFDKEPDYPLFHGYIKEAELLRITPDIPKTEAARIITRWVGPENVALRMQQSLLELGKTLYTWPQLGTAAFLSGTSVACVARQILTGSDIKSGKYIISIDREILASCQTGPSQNEHKRHTLKFKNVLHL
jgi:hypothetical protein